MQGRQLGTQIALFDVADPAGPRLVARQRYPGGWSDAESDPHALLWWPASQLLVVPIADATSQAALALRVSADGLRTLARIVPPAADAESTGPVRRELVIGDTLWTMTDSGLLASSLSTLDTITWVPLR